MRRSHSRLARAGVLAMTFPFFGCWGSAPDDLGPRNGTLAPCPSTPNCVHTGMRQPTGTSGIYLRGEIVRRDQMPRIRAVVEEMPRTRLLTVQDRYLHAEVRSKVFRFVDDLEILISPEREIIVRSASRIGYGDHGVNAARVEELRRRLSEADLIR